MPVLNKVIESIKSANNPNLTTLENDVEALMECEGYAIRQGANFNINNKILSHNTYCNKINEKA